MLVEHSFVTTLEAQAALSQADAFLRSLGFRINSVGAERIDAERGRKKPNTRKVSRLPQTITLVYDRGRVTAAAGITPFKNREFPIHAALMTALVRSLERLLVEGQPAGEAAAEWFAVDASAGKVWTTGDKIALGILLSLVGILVSIIIVSILAAVLA